MDFQGAIKRPFSDIKKFIIGALLNIIPIINFLSLGYVLEAADLSLRKDKSLPEWEEWGDLFIKGLKGFLIAIIWFIPAIVVFFALAGTAIFDIIRTNSLDMSSVAAFTTALSLGGVLALVTWYLLPSAILSFVDKENFKAAFDLRTITKKAFKHDYFVAWIIGIGISIVVTAIFGFIALNIISPLTPIIIMIALFPSMIIMFTLIGEIYWGL